jgi:hypothetical protein
MAAVFRHYYREEAQGNVMDRASSDGSRVAVFKRYYRETR